MAEAAAHAGARRASRARCCGACAAFDRVARRGPRRAPWRACVAFQYHSAVCVHEHVSQECMDVLVSIWHVMATQCYRVNALNL